jgi:hypothetical protein
VYIYLYTSVNFFTFLRTKGRNIHRGALLEAAVKASGISVTQIVKKMGISRGTYYNHKNDPHLSLDQLYQYGKVLKHDFSADLPQIRELELEEGDPGYNQPSTIEEAMEQRDYWREKYYQLMEKYHALLTKG